MSLNLQQKDVMDWLPLEHNIKSDQWTPKSSGQNAGLSALDNSTPQWQQMPGEITQLDLALYPGTGQISLCPDITQSDTV